ncbi:hypothetical protein FC19_GL000057 [Liquorilactobacillus aquaticus DSM 21051]|uniref:DUF3114 domain-containing protein n=1 Tax=Liquorilactobacillus aquaticus DSM 21051 TaxID=1423725 RepID=A0A0R2D480_9LACO|nr:DUF3114 domain-containing protein [Liquorilactobacillus aquaticus]KRM94956.1 hypothetical protein FC19_GL000057 [Liquorilactobacillus aquaticus DSM 21051]
MQEVCKANSIHWPFESIKVLIEQRLSEGQNYSNDKNESNRIGSKLFTQMWRSYAVNKRKENAQNKLTLLMSIVEMETLDGSRKQTQKLLRSFGEITPDSFFWNDLAKTVQIAFPKGLAVSSNQVLAQKIHQFRYVISLQQMEFIREHYSRLNMNDEAALACYLSGLRREQYSLKESARLHQKRKSKNGQGPRGYLKTNIKVVVNFHSEFILSDNGSFVNEIETEKESKENENGVVNGASFNYADANDYRGKNGAKWNSKRSKHYILDINIPKKMEPEFRTEFTRRYKAPSLIRYKLKNDPIYAAANQSAYQINQLAVREFEKKLS